MKKLLTPKQVARAIQVSESSVKRWCDAGTITTEYTAGGHRRISLASLLDFVRSSNYELVSSEVFELAVGSKATQINDELVSQLVDNLLKGMMGPSVRIAVEIYLGGHRVSQMCDRLIAPAFRRIGELWHANEAEVYQERRACGICHEMLHQLREFVPLPKESAPIAIGGAPEGDTYSIATAMVEIVLRENRWRATSLGSNLPFATFEAAIQEHQPRLFWLSVSHVVDREKFWDEYQALYEKYHEQHAFALGGQAVSNEVLRRVPSAFHCEEMQDLERLAPDLLEAAPS